MKLVDTYLNSLNEQEEAVAVAGLTMGAAALAALVAHVFKKCNRTCSQGVGSRRKICVLRCKVLSMTASIRTLKEVKERCKKTKNPEKCVSKIDARIKKIEAKIQDLKDIIEYNTPLVNVKQVK